MSEPTPREYTIQVQQTVLFFEDVVVTAANEEEARALAVEEFQCDWSRSFELRTTTRAAEGEVTESEADPLPFRAILRDLPRLIYEARTALCHYIGDDPLDLHEAASEMYRVLRVLVAWAEQVPGVPSAEESQ
jgi:hypothetical protein